MDLCEFYMAIEVYNGGECDFNDDKTVLNIEGEA
jgi:hypothetical protein